MCALAVTVLAKPWMTLVWVWRAGSGGRPLMQCMTEEQGA